MSGLIARVILGLVVLAATVAVSSYVRALHAERTAAQRQRDDALKTIVDRDSAIRRMQQDAADKANQQVRLDRAHAAIATRLSAVQQVNRRLTNENTTLRAWADTPLPADVVRMHSSAPLTGADDYVEHMPSGEPLHAASDGAADQR